MPSEGLGLDLDQHGYALDSTTIDLCLSLFPWAHFRSTKAAVKMHTLLDLRGNIPSFIHISDGKLHDVHALDMLVPGAGRHLRHGSRLCRFRPPSPAASGRRLLRHPCQIEHGCPSDVFGADRPHHWHDLPIRPSRWTATIPARITQSICGASASGIPETGKTLVFLTNNWLFRPRRSAPSTRAAGRSSFSSNGSSSTCGSSGSIGTSENAVKTQIWIAVSVYVLVAIVRKRLKLDASLYTLMQIFSVALFEKIPIDQALANDDSACDTSQVTNQLNLFAYWPDSSENQPNLTSPDGPRFSEFSCSLGRSQCSRALVLVIGGVRPRRQIA